MAEDKNLSATPKLYHISNSGRGRGPRGPRSQTFTDTPGRSNNNYQHSRQGRGAGRGNVNHGRQPRQQANSSHQTRNNQRQRPRSHSHHDKEFKKIIDGPYAHLFCSERHGFALSRVLYPIEETSLSSCYKDGSTPKITSAQLEKWWESVKLVRCHIPYDETSSMQSILDRCPICLDEEMMAPHVAPCGHTFCLPCVLGYLNSVAKDLNAEAERICKTKQRVPEGKAIIIGSATKTSVAVTTVRARCPMCSSGNSAELTAGDSMVTYRELRPVVCVPVTVVKAKAVSGSLKHQGSRMKFVKLHRALDCPSPYLPLEGHKVRCGSAGASSSPTQRLLPDYPDGDDHEEECMYSRQYYVGCNEYDNVLKRSLDDLLKYSRKSGYCQVDAREKWNVSMAIEAVQASLRRWVGCGGADGGFRSMELEAKVNFTTCASLVELVITQRNVDAIDEIHANPALIEPGTVHLNPDMSECIYYQASDGQMCFLSGINMACLTYEFSLHATERSEAPPSRNTMPLPDSIEGIVLAAESTIVTPELVKRKHFLSHLPLGSSVVFAEIDWHSGGNSCNKPMLSKATLNKFRAEIQRRKSDRLKACKQEEKNDKAARLKSEKEELRRRKEVFGAALDNAPPRQTIDPDDDFFNMPTPSMEEDEATNQQTPTAVFKYNQVCAEMGAFPKLVGSGLKATHPPDTTSKTTPPSWGSSGGRNLVKQPPARTSKVEAFPSLTASMNTKDCDIRSLQSNAGNKSSWNK